MSYKQLNGWFRRVNGLPVKKSALRWPNDNYTSGWPEDRPTGVVWHYTVGCNADISPALKSRGISVHFNVGLKGEIYQFVSVKNRAWHADNANSHYIGIEHAAYPGTCDLTKVQLEASAKLVAALREFYRRKRGFSWPLNKIQGSDLVPGFHDHRDGNGTLWNFNGHTDHLYKWTWKEYLDKIKEVQE